MEIVKGLIGAVIGGAIGAAVWAAIAYFTGFEAGIVAWGIGGLVGFGMVLGTKGSYGLQFGVIAAIIALASIAAGKYMAIHAVTVKFTSNINANMKFTDDDAKVYMADQLIQERVDAGKEVKWPDGKSSDDAESIKDYPKDIAKDVESRWKAMTPDAQRTYVDQTAAHIKSSMTAAIGGIEAEAFKNSFGLFDLLWAFLAVGTAFKLGSGGAGGDD
jgi:hypothetical protein